ncbi:hypothetical protein Mapa_004827 [Marchantia paleacea]|nr:hypothetical protein Mapa_004827 [Marchantia paleacea]
MLFQHPTIQAWSFSSACAWHCTCGCRAGSSFLSIFLMSQTYYDVRLLTSLKYEQLVYTDKEKDTTCAASRYKSSKFRTHSSTIT